MRAFLVVIMILAIGAAIAKLVPQNAATAPTEPAGPTYSEARVKIAAQQREIEIVVVGEHPTARECDSHSGNYQFPEICSDGTVNCKLTKVECSETLGDRYVNMLAKKPAGVHYVHYERRDVAIERKHVLVAWGMTAEESQLVCTLARDAEARKPASAETVTCI